MAYFLLSITYIALCILCCVLADKRGRSGLGYLVLSIFLSPLVVLVVILRLKPKSKNRGQLTNIPDIMSLIGSGLDSDEVFIAACDFAVTGTQITSVLTNRHIRFMRFKSGRRGKNPRLVANSAVALRAISGISTSEAGAGIFQLVFWWEGHTENLVTSAIPDGKAFAGKLKEAVAGRDMSSGRTSLADEIQRLAQLTDEGVLTQEEWSRAKDHLIGASPSQVDEAAKLLRQLHALLVQGVLSESEYNMKKWDVLSQRLLPRDKPRTPPPTG